MRGLPKEREAGTVARVCPKHGEYAAGVFTFDVLGSAMEFTQGCPLCREEAEAKERREEGERQKRREAGKWRGMNIGPRFYGSTLDNFDAYSAELREHLETCRRFAENPDGKLVMLGGNGNGKTHLAVGVLKEVGGAIYTAYEIGIKLRQGYGGEAKEWEVFEGLCAAPLLVIDEVEKIKDSESKQHWLSHVVGKRYDRMLPMIFIANCHRQKDCRQRERPCPRCLEYHLENDVLSRIIEDGIIMDFTGGDYREKIRDARRGAR
jgi:DNA replication protein DnaC